MDACVVTSVFSHVHYVTGIAKDACNGVRLTIKSSPLHAGSGPAVGIQIQLEEQGPALVGEEDTAVGRAIDALGVGEVQQSVLFAEISVVGPVESSVSSCPVPVQENKILDGAFTMEHLGWIVPVRIGRSEATDGSASVIFGVKEVRVGSISCVVGKALESSSVLSQHRPSWFRSVPAEGIYLVDEPRAIVAHWFLVGHPGTPGSLATAAVPLRPLENLLVINDIVIGIEENTSNAPVIRRFGIGDVDPSTWVLVVKLGIVFGDGKGRTGVRTIVKAEG
mmetsp:Transcript_32946/g.97240  ORF Transcript_32946/g.97240 Transcript_32946/m.97240 type:complete len:279 (-) Transcript_32946:351-1187(-)